MGVGCRILCLRHGDGLPVQRLVNGGIIMEISTIVKVATEADEPSGPRAELALRDVTFLMIRGRVVVDLREWEHAPVRV